MSDTPRTDAREQRVAGPNAWDPRDTTAVHADFARELERENNALRKLCGNAEPTPEPPGMTSKQAMKLPLGLYCVFWTEAAGGGMSVAAVGAMHSGKRWLAPANWTAKDERFPNVASSGSWHDVERVERIESGEEGP